MPLNEPKLEDTREWYRNGNLLLVYEWCSLRGFPDENFVGKDLGGDTITIGVNFKYITIPCTKILKKTDLFRQLDELTGFPYECVNPGDQRRDPHQPVHLIDPSTGQITFRYWPTTNEIKTILKSEFISMAVLAKALDKPEPEIRRLLNDPIGCPFEFKCDVLEAIGWKIVSRKLVPDKSAQPRIKKRREKALLIIDKLGYTEVALPAPVRPKNIRQVAESEAN